MRVLYFSALILLQAIMAFPAIAQRPLELRAASHEGYTRVVFDVGHVLSYDFSRVSDFEVKITFAEPVVLGGSLDINGLAANVQGQDTVSITFDTARAARHFSIGSRIVVDIDDAEEGAAQAPKPEKEKPVREEPAPAPEPEPELISEPVNITPLAKKPEAAADVPLSAPSQALLETPDLAKDPAKAIQSQIPQIVEPEIKVKLEEAKRKINPILANEKRLRPSLVTISSTRSTNMAVFQLYDEIWMVNDREDLLLSPQISGQHAKEILPIQDHPLKGGKAYKVNAINGAQYRIQGGGLLWRIIVSSQYPEGKVIKPQRLNVPSDRTRGGTLLWAFEGASEVIDTIDPYTGLPLKIVTVDSSKDFAGEAMEFVDFKVLRSPLGLAIMPKVDDLSVEITERGVEVSRPIGLALSPQVDIDQSQAYRAEAVERAKNRTLVPKSDVDNRVFDFKGWQMGDEASLRGNRTIMFSALESLRNEQRHEGLLDLARIHLSHALGQEALGFLNLVQREVPDIATHPEYIVLKGVAEALSWHSEEALNSFIGSDFENSSDIRYWKSYALADLGDWQQAEDTLPLSFDALYDYPSKLAIRLSLRLLEISLRAGDEKRSEALFTILDKHKAHMNLSQNAALQYLEGEAARQRGDTDKATEMWAALSRGADDFYRTRAGLALTRLQVDADEISPEQAIETLERLRYAWRGDDLEAQVNYWLGRTYFDDGAPVKGLNIMRDAAGYAQSQALRGRITRDMRDIFVDLFFDAEKLKQVAPPEAATLYERFSELMPSGATGNQITQNLAEHLVASDVFERADDLLQYLLDHKLKGVEAFRTATRLAAIRLIDKRPDDAEKAIQKAQQTFESLLLAEQTDSRHEEIVMLRASVLAERRNVTEALELLRALPKTPQVNRLRADIAWRAAYWQDAAEALGEVIIDEGISLTRPLSPDHITLILQHAVALNLAGDRIRLANTRERYTKAMNQTPKARVFEVITRPRKSAVLADRKTLQSIVSEVELFSDFLESYKKPQR